LAFALYTLMTNDNYSVVAGKGILMSAIATGLLGFVTAILFLFCTPDLDTVFALDAPQPFVQIYALALGKGGSIFMTVIAVIGLIMVCLIPGYGSKQP
jgi:translation initiation factor 5B